MFKTKNDNLTYITSFGSEAKKTDDKNTSHNHNNKSISKKRFEIFKTIEISTFIHKKKLPKIKYPLLNQNKKNKISTLFDKNHKSLNKIAKKNLLNVSDKTSKKLDLMISKINYLNDRNISRNKYLQIHFNSDVIDKMIQRDKFININTSPIKKEKNRFALLHNVRSAKNIKTLFINNIEFNLNKENRIKSRSIHILGNSSSSRSQKIKSNFVNKKKVLSIIDNFKKKEKQLEESKKQLYTYSLNQFSARLLRKKGKKENTKRKIVNPSNNGEEEYKIQTMIFKNKKIPYIDKIDIRKISTNLPPIVIGSRYFIPEKSEEVIKREEFNEAINQIIEKSKKIKQRIKINLTKKEILNKVRQRNIQLCNKRIHKTEEDVHYAKNKIIKDCDSLKLSLNQFDNWNSPENIDNLFG